MADTENGKKDAAPTNPRGIPYAPFVDKVEDYVSSRADVEQTLKNFQEMIAKYQFMEANQQRRAAGLKGKMPDIQKTLETVRFLKSRKSDAKPIEATFELNDTLYAKANVPYTNDVYLWLGANVMLSYPINEAEELLISKLSAAKHSLENCEEDLDFLREQITVRINAFSILFLVIRLNQEANQIQTMEVATARVYNWDVTMKRKELNEGGNMDGISNKTPNG
ncbi:putative prefoldin subunit 3 [Erysiphe neolycopersici]|uniref:Prefoldin subunit 3 n=1 Tax=Erysiphe neolycopersici TaxID=212602 RepID=A0A420HZJ8_9PEZI|nr:putative prefoldin subunit 3 [Erysiphe neolycopersici]